MTISHAALPLRAWGLAVIAALMAVGTEAAPIAPDDVARAIGNWRHRRGTLGTKMGETVRDVRRVSKGEIAVYVVRFEGGGTVIAPCDDTERPVIMFSETDDFDPNPDNPAWDLLGSRQDAVKATSAANSGNDPDSDKAESPSAAKNRAAWAELMNDDAPEFRKTAIDDVRVAPLISTRWEQEEDKDGRNYCYNYYTPNHYCCGCVATATAQILRKFAYMGPKAYVGTYTNPHCEVDEVEIPQTTKGAPYDWANMPDIPNWFTSDNERKAIGNLTSDVGIMVGMDYTKDGSGSTTYMGKLVFEKFFGYSSAMATCGTGQSYTGKNDLFQRMLMSNFDAKLPVQLGISGHSIVGDGYGYNGGVLYYHLNFGWGNPYAAWYNPPDDMEGYQGFYAAVYNIYTNQNYSASTVIASGRVTRGGNPVSCVRVSAAAVDDPETEVASVTTDEKGIYALFVPAGEYRVSAIAEQYERYEISGETIARPAACVSTIPVETGYYNCQQPDKSVVGNAAECDIALELIEYDPEAEIAVGEVSVLTNFECATIPVTAKVVHYGQTATSAKVVVTLTPVGGGVGHVALPGWTKEFVIDGDFDAHEFTASFDGLTAGGRYEVSAKVVMNTDEEAGLTDDGFATAREFAWFDESAASFSAAKWSGVPVKVADGKLSIACPPGTLAAFTPAATNVTSVRIVVNVRECGHYQKGMIPGPDGLAAVSAVLQTNGQTELFVWGEGTWHATGYGFAEEDADFDVSVDLDFLGHSVRYGAGDVTLGTFALPDAIGVSSVSFKGDLEISELSGTAWDANLVRDANGTEYASYDAAKASGATGGVLSPLWLSTWCLSGGSGAVEVADPLGLIAYTGDSRIVKSETNKVDGVVRHWYAQASDADIAAGAAKYIETTVELGLAKAITGKSVVKIGDFAVAEGSMIFKVAIGEEEVTKAAIMSKVEISETLGAGWRNPDADEIVFDVTKHEITVTPKFGDGPACPPRQGFVRVRIIPDEEDVK